MVNEMKVAFATEEKNGLDSIVSTKFGRVAYFVIVELDNDKKIKDNYIIVNPGGEARSGAAIKAVQKLLEEKVAVVVAGAFGPNALVALDEMNIKHIVLSGVKVSEALGQITDKL